MKAAAAAAFEQDAGDSTPLVGSSKAAAANGSSSSCSSAAIIERYSHPLVVPSDTAFKALLIAPLVVWWVAVLAGAWVYEGLPKGQKVYHVMMWFDKGLLRPAGPLVPFVVVLLRAAVHWGEHHWQLHSTASIAAAGAGRRRQEVRVRLGSLLLNCLTVYSAMAVARLAIYLTHYFLLSQRLLEFHLVSDHIFLAATMLISLHTEVVCLMSDLLRVEHTLADAPTAGGNKQQQDNSLPLSEVFLTLLLVLALFLYLFTAADMYFTAKYYHFPLESITTTVLVFIMFQCPMLVWMIRRRQRVAAQHKG